MKISEFLGEKKSQIGSFLDCGNRVGYWSGYSSSKLDKPITIHGNLRHIFVCKNFCVANVFDDDIGEMTVIFE